MTSIRLHRRLALAAAASLALLGTAALAQTKEVTFAHQDMLVPLRTVMESGELEKATGYKINWRMFGGGGDVIRAMASGDVQIGEVGSSRRRRGGQPGPGHQAVLDPRRHRRRRGAGRAQRQRHQRVEGPEGQEGRDAVRLDLALPAAWST